LSSPWLSVEEKKSLMQKNDLKAAWYILIHWLWIFSAFAIIYYLPNPITIIIACFILGGKQLACAVLMHDASHFSIFNNRKINDLVGNWLGAFPVFNQMFSYRPYHKLHHISTGTIEDPDLMLTRAYPTDKISMLRKFSRDLLGITGLKSYVGLFLMHIGYLRYNTGGKIEKAKISAKQSVKMAIRNLTGPILANIFLFTILTLLFYPAIYLFWILSLLTTFQFSLRIRSMAEHSVVEDQMDPIKNTRTTNANFLEKMLFAPYCVNYHLEHHMLMTVPFYQLPKMHRLIKSRGFYSEGNLANNYLEIIRLAASGNKKYD